MVLGMPSARWDVEGNSCHVWLRASLCRGEKGDPKRDPKADGILGYFQTHEIFMWVKQSQTGEFDLNKKCFFQTLWNDSVFGAFGRLWSRCHVPFCPLQLLNCDLSLGYDAAPMAAGYETRHLYTTFVVGVGTMGGFNISQTDTWSH